MMVTWIDTEIANPQPASERAVRDAEDALRVDLPADFLSLARTRQGSAPRPNSITLPNGFVTGIAHLFHFEEKPFVSNIVAAGFPVESVLDKGVIPFAADGTGGLFCFSYRHNYDAPPVLYWNVDWGELPLAESFTDLVALLHD